MFFSKINPKQPPAGSHFSLQMNRFQAEKQQQMPQCCSAGSREATVHTGLTPGTSDPGGCAMSSWPGAGELHPADACCCFFPSPWVHSAGEVRDVVELWELKEKAVPSFHTLGAASKPGKGRGSYKKRASLGWPQEASLLQVPCRRQDKGLCWALSGLSGTESKAGLPVTGFTYSTPGSLSQLTCKGKRLRTVGSQEACHLRPCATNLHMHLPPCAKTSLSQQRKGVPPETSSAQVLPYSL